MGLAGASAGALSGIIVQGFGFPVLTLVAAVATAPVAILAGAYTYRREKRNQPL